MKAINRLFSFVIFWMLFLDLQAQTNSLRVSDVRNTTYSVQGTIEEALVSVRPKGLYMEIGLYLSFSARGSNFKANDSLEVVLQFKLPEKSVITDSWLWIGNEICQAALLDVWTASNIYENIVKRRRDPSLLTKTSSNGYVLRVFPMGGNERRQVKITYLVPINWSGDRMEVPLPVDVINTSRYIPLDFPVIFWDDPNFKFENTDNSNRSPILESSDPVLGDYKTTTFKPVGSFAITNLQYTSKIPLPVYAGSYADQTTNYYQLALRLQDFIPDSAISKLLFLVDYQDDGITSKELLLNSLKAKLRNFLRPTDSFNIVFSNINPQLASNSWIPAYDYNIDSVIDVQSLRLASYSNLPNILYKGIDFMNLRKQNANIVLLNNSDQFSNYLTANDLIKELRTLNRYGYKISVLDYCLGSKTTFVNNKVYYNNEYLLRNLATLWGGLYTKANNSKPISIALDETLQDGLPNIENFEVYCRPTNGIAYGKYNFQNLGSSLLTTTIFQQTGAFKGDFPLIVYISGEYNHSIFAHTLTLDRSQVAVLDSSAKKQWQAQGLLQLESSSQANQNSFNIISKSLEARILSLYTAFLCLEDTSLYCHTCIDEKNVPTANEEIDQDSLWESKIYPNPFSDVLNIEIHFKDQLPSGNSLSGKIMDLGGRIIRSFKVSRNANNILEYRWDGTDLSGKETPSGVYIIILETKQGIIRQKVIKA